MTASVLITTPTDRRQTSATGLDGATWWSGRRAATCEDRESSMVAPLPPAQAEEARRYVALCRATLDSHRPAEAHGRVAVRTVLGTRPGPGRSGGAWHP